MKKTFLKTVVILITAIMTFSYSIDGADTVTGATRPAGANGTNGVNGIYENANILGSTPFTKLYYLLQVCE